MELLLIEMAKPAAMMVLCLLILFSRPLLEYKKDDYIEPKPNKSSNGKYDDLRYLDWTKNEFDRFEKEELLK